MAKDLTQGRIMPMLIKFTIPLILGNIFQLTYNAVDSIIVGRFVGKEALAAVGICNPITTLIFFSLTDYVWVQVFLWVIISAVRKWTHFPAR